jgi:hypothetical protein
MRQTLRMVRDPRVVLALHPLLLARVNVRLGGTS